MSGEPLPLLRAGEEQVMFGLPKGLIYIPIAWYPESTYSIVPVTFAASSESR